MKILIDMNLSPRWVDYLVENDIDAVHWTSIGSPDAPDTEIITYAKEHDLTILTNDLDFGFILAITHGKKPSIIQTRIEVLAPEIIGDTVINAIKLLINDINHGALVTIDPRKTRVSILPLLTKK